uniref:GH10 domain-containing protein n=1 Tax=Biomphalaria glabrata TaxID=6526 RepID=A0A2C9KN81_BIOGL
MFSFILTCVFVIWSLERSDGAPELLQNPGFENGTNHWNVGGFTAVAQTAVVHGGHAALKCSGRTQTWQGPSQDVVVKPGGQYAFSSFFKLAADVPGVSSQSVAIKIHFKFKDTGEDNFFQITNRPRIKAADGWVQLGADFLVPTREFQCDGQLLSSSLDSLIDHTKHLFGFGTQLRSDYIVSPDYKQLQNIIYYLFNWATIEEYKWTYNRGTREHPDFTMAVAATDELRKHGLNVRGHCMFWAVGGATQPSYVTAMSGQTLKDTVDEHIRYMTGITKGK